MGANLRNTFYVVSQKSDVWNSSDGINWNLVTNTAPFGARYQHGCLSFDGKLWVIGGQDPIHPSNAVWYTVNGTDWTRAVEHADFHDIQQHGCVVFDNKMWVMGGAAYYIGYVDDVWWSN